MSKPPPENLMDWAKGDLAKEVRRLRAIVYEHADRTHDTPREPGPSDTIIDTSVARQIGAQGDPYARGNILLDAREAVLMDSLDVCLVDTYQGGEEGGEQDVVLAMSVAGRVNYSVRRSETLFLFDGDGAAAIVSQLVGLAVRIGPEFAADLMKRLEELP